MSDHNLYISSRYLEYEYRSSHNMEYRLNSVMGVLYPYIMLLKHKKKSK